MTVKLNMITAGTGPLSCSIIDQLTQATDILLKQNNNRSAMGWKLPNLREGRTISTVLLGSVFMATSLFSGIAASQSNALGWKTNAAFLYYKEAEGRVTALEPVLSFKKTDANDDNITIKLVIDSLTGASPTGAVVSPKTETFTTPSGQSTYDVTAFDIPVDDSFKDTRIAVSSNWLTNIAENKQRTLGFGFSKELDYTSLSGNSGLSFTSEDGNSDLTLGISLAYDTIEAQSKSLGLDDEAANSTAVKDSKFVLDLLLGFTKTVNHTTLFQTGLSISASNGYLTDPYKIISIVDSDDSQQNGIGIAERTVNEVRPDSRVKLAAYTRLKTWLAGNILDISYRISSDDWGLSAHTLDTRYRFILPSWYVQPRLRYYKQESIDYYRYVLLDVEPLPTYFTADDRLGDFYAITLGAEFGRNPDAKRSFRYAIELYNQRHKRPTANLIGALATTPESYDLPSLILRINYQF